MKYKKGFTLIELLVAMAIAGIVIASVYAAYRVQQKSYLAQDQVAAMQQNLRAAIIMMEREIRMAGYDPLGSSGARIEVATATMMRFTMDIHDGVDNDGDGSIDEDDEAGSGDGDTGDVNENIIYVRLDPDGDGIFDLLRRDGVVPGDQLIAENIDALDFVYLDQDGNVTGTLGEIRSVQITVVARTARFDRGYRDTDSYLNQQGTVILPQQGDSFRRRRLTAEAICRNLTF